ncbi:plasmid stabilization protein [Chromatiaceae bacterium AAb-1]|nr:plasmid stabilization protein [Chromatiaceae bacterium AAb-1]
MLTVRNLPDDVHRALRVRAASHGRSTEAEVREILAAAVKPEQRLRLGDALAALVHDIGLSNEDVEALEQMRDKTPAIAASRGFIVASCDKAPYQAGGVTVIDPWKA